MIGVWLFLTVPWVCMQFVIVVFPGHTHLLFKVLVKRPYLSLLQVLHVLDSGCGTDNYAASLLIHGVGNLTLILISSTGVICP